jgi:hypothetical protein
MGRQDVNSEFNTFVGGILTEANPINYPKGYTLDEENFILERNGTRRRRYGLRPQPGGDTPGTAASPAPGGTLVLDDYQGTGDSYVIMWDSGNIEVFKVEKVYEVVNGYGSNNPTQNLESVATATVFGITDIVEYKGDLIIITAWGNHPTYITAGLYSSGINVPSYQIRDIDLVSKKGTTPIMTRDYAGYSDKEVFDFNPTTLTITHHYNLLNNGWSTTNINQYFTDTGTYPSLAQDMNTGLDAATGAFTSTWVDLGNSGANAYRGGKFLVTPVGAQLDRGQVMLDEGYTEAAITAATLPTLTGSTFAGYTRMSAVIWNGRLCTLAYSTGDYEEPIKPFLYISQVLEDVESPGKMYRINNPVARDNSGPLDTDGLYLELSDIGVPIKLMKSTNGLAILSTQGLREVYAAQGNFTPGSVAIRPISDYKTYASTFASPVGSHLSTVTPEGDIYYLSREGVIKCEYDSRYNSYKVDNITKKSIDNLYRTELTPVNIANAMLYYSISSKTIRVLYNSNTSQIVTTIFGPMYDRELVLDLPLGAWYRNVYGEIASLGDGHMTNYYGITNLFEVPQLREDDVDYPFPYSNTYVVNTVSYDPDLVMSGAVTVTTGLAFMHHTPGTFTDTAFQNLELGTIDNGAFLQTGYINMGDSQRQKQADYIIPSFIRTETGFTDDGSGNLTATNESSCLISAYWDYADHDNSVKIGTQFEAYRLTRPYIPSGAADAFDYGQSVITTKNRISGRGRALSLRFESSAGKDCQLLGWGLGMEINQRV